MKNTVLANGEQSQPTHRATYTHRNKKREINEMKRAKERRIKN